MITSACSHRDKRLVVDLKDETYAIQCRTCLLTGEQAPSGVGAMLEWLRMLRLEREAVTA